MSLEKDNQYFIIAPNIIFDEYVKKIGRDACFLYLYLLRRKGHKSSCFPSYTAMQSDCCMSRASVSKALSSLAKVGLLVKQRTARGNKYYLNDKKFMEKNISYYQQKDYEKDDFVLPEIDAEFKLDTTVVQNEYYGSSNKVLEDRNREDRNKEGRNIGGEENSMEANASESLPPKSKPKLSELKLKPDHELTRDELILVKTDKLFTWAYERAKINGKLPVGKSALEKWIFAGKKTARNWVEEYIDDLGKIAKIIEYCETDPYWDVNFKNLNQFNTIRTQLQEKYFKEMK